MTTHSIAELTLRQWHESHLIRIEFDIKTAWISGDMSQPHSMCAMTTLVPYGVF